MADKPTRREKLGAPDRVEKLILSLGTVYDAIQGGMGEHRAVLTVVAAGWPADEGFDARASAQRLEALGLIGAVASDGSVRPVAAAWDVVRGSIAFAASGWARHRPASQLPDLDTLVLPAPLRADCVRVPAVLSSGLASAVILRGPRHNGRATLAAALSRRMGKGVLEMQPLDGARDPRWRTAASLACLLDAALLTVADPAPGEQADLPDVPSGLAPLFVTLGAAGGVTGPAADRAVTLRLSIPDAADRDRLWRATLGADAVGVPALRMTSGNIVRAARVARAEAAAAGRLRPDAADLRAAVRTLDRPGLESLARRVEAAGDWSLLAVSTDTMSELTTLAARCRQRERLGAFVGPALGGLGPGVRALFKGPSGTGKTVAARLLAGTLGMDLYRVDLSAVVNKYIGETEKNLERVFARAEELDIILLLDEGDALLTQRTGVQNANDRYANLETNYLLQRFETYEGILIVTTNAGERIDGAFQRRMDVVIDFALPDACERWELWQLHLPERHELEAELLGAVAQRCALTGGQIRNVALHASLLAVESDSPIAARHVEAAIEREYRKQGAMSPLRARAGAR